ncbi:MAG: hypothetical protein ACOX86_00445 [Pelotomaculaceae bacterium]|nr:hypothetical protein [Bacillota bacterium]HHU85497.1 hypothetical protein [Peptococcaceae bacterium]
MGKGDKKKISINANPAGTLEIEEFKIRMAEQFHKTRPLERNAKKNK